MNCQNDNVGISDNIYVLIMDQWSDCKRLEREKKK